MFRDRVLFKKRKIETDRQVDTGEWDKLFDDLDEAFPNSPFIVSCVDEISELDHFFDEEEIRVIDDRNMRNIHETVVRQKNNKPITLRQVIKVMLNDEHYHKDTVKNDPHRFLDGFTRLTVKGEKLNQYILNFDC